MLIALAGAAYAEIVPVTPPPVEIVSKPVPDASVPVDPALPMPTPTPTPTLPPPVSSNIFWPTAPASAESVTGDVAGQVDEPRAGGSAASPVEAAEIVGGSDDPLQRALTAYHGQKDPRSYSEAARWFKVAADAGDRRAAMAFAYLQGLGLGVVRDPASARRSLLQISAAGVARADYLLSLLLAADRRPGGDRQQAELRERAARAGDAVAQNAMGVHYQVEGDRTTAQMWYQRAADNGSAAARLNLASLARSDEARRQVEVRAETAADGDAESLFILAGRYHRGDGVAVDYGKALRLYRQAAAKGSKPAQQMLGLIQSRTPPGGGFDPTWMRLLASAAVGTAGGNPVSNIASAAQPRLDDPLAGLSDLGR